MVLLNTDVYNSGTSIQAIYQKANISPNVKRRKIVHFGVGKNVDNDLFKELLKEGNKIKQSGGNNKGAKKTLGTLINQLLSSKKD